MKRFTLTIAVLVVAGFGLMAQTTFFTENFSSTNLPSGWQNVDNSGGGTWARKTSSHSFASTTASNGFMIFDADAKGNDSKAENADLITAAINCSGHNHVALQFEQYFQQYAAALGTVFVSTDGVSWSQVYTVTNTTDNPEVTLIDITTVAANQPTVYIKFNYTGDYDYWWAIDDIKLFEPAALDISVESITNNQYVGLSNQTVSGVVKNNGAETITSFDMTYTDNGGSAVVQSVSGVNIQSFQTYSFSFNQPIAMSTPMLHTIVVNVSAPNNGSETNLANNSATKDVTALSAIPVKNALIEEFTTAQCQYCPRGTSTMNGILAGHSNIIGVALHAGFGTDAMTTADHSTVAAAFTSGAPTAAVDRVLFAGEEAVGVDDGNWETYGVQETNRVTPVAIIADNTYNSGTRELVVNTSAKFFGPINDDFRINCYIIEDSVTGTGSGYNQINAYNSVSSSEWYQKGNPIVGFQHRHVCRQMLGGAWGSTGVISTPTTDGGVYSKQYTYTLPAGWNDSRVKLVVLVQHYAANKNDRNILNAMELDLNSADSTRYVAAVYNGIKEVSATNVGEVSLYPNPAADILNISYTLSKDATVSFGIYNIIGQNVMNIEPSALNKGDYRTRVNTADLKNGVYFVSVKENNKTVNTLKFVVNK